MTSETGNREGEVCAKQCKEMNMSKGLTMYRKEPLSVIDKFVRNVINERRK